ncbi:RTN1 family protein [Megaselia abdita]
MDFDWKDELEKKPVAVPEPQTKNILQLSDSEEEDSFEYKKNPEPLKPVVQQSSPSNQQPLIDEFEHVTNPVGDFIHNTSEKINSRYDDLISGFGEGKTNLENKIDKTLDFLSSERGEVPLPQPVVPLVAELPKPVVPEPVSVPEEEEEEESKNNYDYFEDDSPAVSAHTSPAKKSTIVTDLDDKFISSEDLLSDLKTDSKEKESSKPKTIEEFPAKTSVLPSVQKKLEEKFSGVLDDISSIATSGVESLNASLPKVNVTTTAADPVSVPDIKIVSVQKLFAEYGLVESLIYWRDVKKSGIVFGAGLITLLAVSCFSVISVLAYLSIFLLTGAVAFRIYKTIMTAVHKTNEGHPFKEYLEVDVTVSQEKSQEVCGTVVAHFNGFVTELRRLFLVEDLIDSLKFGGILWLLTYIGAWFNGMTLVTMAYVALFTLPKVYENNKQSIDAYLELVHGKISEITDKVRSAVPIGKSAPVESEKDK